MAPYYEIVRSKTCATPYGDVSCGGPVQVSSGPSCVMGAQLQYNPNAEAGDGLCGRLRDYKGDMCTFNPDPNYVECSESDVEDCAIAEAETGLPCASLCHRWTKVVYTLLDIRGGSCTVVDIRPRCEEAALRFGVSFSVISDVSMASGCVYLSSGVVWNTAGVSCDGFTCVCMQRVPLEADTPASTFVSSTVVPETSQQVTETNIESSVFYVAPIISIW